MRRIILLAAALVLAVPDSPADEGKKAYVWWEGEDTADTNFPRRGPFDAANYAAKRDGLSGGDWLTNGGKRTGDEAFAKYSIEVPEAGAYDLWTRKFWKHGPFRWRFGDAAWATCGRECGLADSYELATHICANWVSLGRVNLAKGKTTFELRLLAKPGEELTSCFDCFVLTRQPFEPRGKLKPDERSGKADAGFFAWEPSQDAFAANALLDLRSLNEKVAGESGYVKRDGARFTLGNGKPVRFWAVNAGPEIWALDHASHDYLARRLAKVGVNMVRLHGPSFQEEDPSRIDAKRLDDLQHLVASLAKEGIYSELSFFFPVWLKLRGADTFSFLYFDAEVQGLYRGWAKALLATANPYARTPLGKDPAVAIVEVVNEDSHFFWTFKPSAFPEEKRQALEKLYGDWLVRRSGSIEKAGKAWDGVSEPGDAAGRMQLYDAWWMTADGVSKNAAKTKRIGDQVRFLSENMRGFYAETARFLHGACGYAGLVSASNWQTADPRMLDALERYGYTACDVIDRHGYFGGKHDGDGSSYSVQVGHTFTNLSALVSPEALPIPTLQIDGYPHIISEIGWTNPNLYRADYSFLAAAYDSLQGIDGTFAFAVGSAFWDQGMSKFAVTSPAILGNFPAHALLYRRGDVKEADEVVHQVIDLEDLYAMKGSGGFTAQALDAFRAANVPPGAAAKGEVSSIDPLAGYVGRMTRTFGKDPRESRQVNLESYVDRQAKTVKSLTGELFWDYGRGYATMNAPRAQGAAGFLGRAGRLDLGCVSIAMRNEYGTVTVVSLDGEAIETSKRVLIQAMTVERPFGFRANGGKEGKITDVGSGPLGVERIDCEVTLRLKGKGAPRVVALDEHGYRTAKKVGVKGGSEALSLTLSPDSAYFVIER